MLNLEELEVKLAELRRLCVHSWDDRKQYIISATYTCQKCDKTFWSTDGVLPFIDDPIANSVGKLINFVQEKKLAYKLEDVGENSVGATVYDTNKRAYICV